MTERIFKSPLKKLVSLAFSAGNDSSPHFVTVLNIGEDALAARLHLIRSARESIFIQVYIWGWDTCARLVFAELMKAAERGVRVRLLIDPFASCKDTSIVAAMAAAHPGILIKYYNPIEGKLAPANEDYLNASARSLKKVNQRMHNKLFLVDDKIGITGGRNYQNDYYDFNTTRNFKDRDVLVIGSVVEKMVESFWNYWRHELTEKAEDLRDVREKLERKEFDSWVPEKLVDRPETDGVSARADNPEVIEQILVRPARAVKKIRFVDDEPGKNKSPGLKGGGRTQRAMQGFLGKASVSVVAQTPYVVLDSEMSKADLKYRKHHPDVDVLISTNSLAATDNLVAYAFAYKSRKKYLEKFRFRMFEFKPVPRDIEQMMPRYPLLKRKFNARKQEIIRKMDPPKERSFEKKDVHLSIHAKTFIVDSRAVWIGSFNLDPRSVNLNTEVGLIIGDEVFAREVEEDIRRDMAPGNSWAIAKARKPALRSHFSGLIGWLLRLPFFNIWPYRWAESFELIEGREPVSCFDPRFYENYRSVGRHPEVRLNTREVEIGLIQSFGGFIEPFV